jgi:hypothetical protein
MPFATVGFLGVTSSETREVPATVRVVAPEILPDEAVIVVTPADSGMADPFAAASLLIVATERSEELHVNEAVMS